MAGITRTEHDATEPTSKNQDQIFQAVGQQVQNLSLDETSIPDELQGRVVPTEVIESLCMNCHKDVRSCPGVF